MAVWEELPFRSWGMFSQSQLLAVQSIIQTIPGNSPDALMLGRIYSWKCSFFVLDLIEVVRINTRALPRGTRSSIPGYPYRVTFGARGYIYRLTIIRCFSYLGKLQLQTRAVLMPYFCLKNEKGNSLSIGGGHKPLLLSSFPF